MSLGGFSRTSPDTEAMAPVDDPLVPAAGATDAPLEPDTGRVPTAGTSEAWLADATMEYHATYTDAPDMELPDVGDLVVFNYPYDHVFAHQVYDANPGDRVGPDVAYVDFTRAVQVEEVEQRDYWVRLQASEMPGNRRSIQRRNRPHGYVRFTAVRFTSNNGTALWANYARGTEQWMRVVWSPDA